MAIYGYTKNYKLIKPKYDTDTWHDYEYDNLDTIDAVLSAIYASGDWQGFWKSNTHYNVGDIVIDRDTDTMYKVMVEHTTSAGSFAAEWTAHHTYYELWSPNDLAESWATKTDGKVSDTDYSSKAYAISSGLINDGSAKEWAVKSGKIGNTNEYSAKKYATDAHNDYISMTTNPNVVAVGSNINNVNAVGQSISNVNTVAGNVSSVNAVGNNISSVNTAASNMAAIQAAPTAVSNAANSANNSHIWAEGTDAQVAALGGVHSSKGWAQQSTSVNISLTNTPYTTNRILEIPQDIKLELNDGMLTLKAGSKVYVPNGFEADGTTLKFDEVVIEGNINGGQSGKSSGVFYFVSPNRNSMASSLSSSIYSGSTEPTGTTYAFWYDTINNRIGRRNSGSSTFTFGYSFPVCVGTIADNLLTSIDQVFNGFGYMGSTVFVLPGVKVQIPNGRNEDGTCKSLITNTTSVKTLTVNASWGTYDIFITRSWGIGKWPDIVSGSAATRYNAATNYYEVMSDGKWISQLDCVFAKVKADTTSPYKITSFEPYTVDSVVNSNEFYQLRDKAVTTNTAQTISGSKRFTQPSAGMSIEFTANTNQQTVPAETTSRQLGLYRNATYTKGDGYTSWFQGLRGSDGWTSTELYARKFLEGDSQEILNYIKAIITSDGTPISYTKTPPIFVTGEEIVTAGWFNQKMQVVSALPAAPDANVFYFIPD